MRKYFRLFIWMIVLILFLNLLFKTRTDIEFVEWGGKTLKDVFVFHYRYPEELLIFIVFTLFPSIYYTFIRGNNFYEYGFTLNKGIPFLNQKYMYEDFKSYKIANFNNLIVLKKKSNDTLIHLQSHDVSRVVSILDQQNLEGDFSKEEYFASLNSNKKLLIYFFIFSLIIFILQHFGWIRYFLK